MKKKGLEVTANILFWGLSTWLITRNFSIQSIQMEMLNGVRTVVVHRNTGIIICLAVAIILSIAMFYTNLRVISKLKNRGKSYRITALSILLVILAVSIYKIIETLPLFPNHPPLPASMSIGTIIFYYAVSITYGLAKIIYFSEAQRQKLLLQKNQAELSLLRSQLHPHFLFNTLNNFLYLVDPQKNPSLAGAINQLSALLRYVVYDVAEGKVAVSKEIDFIRNFAELQRLRFEKDEVSFNLEVRGINNRQQVEPGIFIPFIENAFKYGVEPEKQSVINVLFDLSEPDRIKFSCSNVILPAMQSGNDVGSGLRSVRERLQLIYPDAHKLNISENKYYYVEMEIRTT